MQLYIQQRVFSWSDTYDVYDAEGNARYYVRAEVFAFGHQIHVYDKKSGQEVGSIHQKLFVWMPQFEIVIGGRAVGTVRREFTFFKPRYHVDFCRWEVEGDFLGWNYTARQAERTVLTVSRELLTWGDAYVLDYTDPADELPALLLTIAIDAAGCHDD